jgi:histidinol dehydrogenase
MKIMTYPSAAAQRRLAAIAGRDLAFRRRDVRAVERILADVKRDGDAAVLTYARRYDAPELSAVALAVAPVEFDAALKAVDRSFLRALDRAIAQVRDFHQRQRSESWISTPRPGTVLGQLVHPVDAAGLYVPGGRAGSTPLVSSLVMNAVPALIAGVPTISLVTPPRRDGSVDPHLLAAARRVGVNGVYKAGSAWGIAALAYGTATIPRADVIVGPGNLWVTLAKKLVAGTVGIDMIAGPSEILVLADASAEPECVAADLLSQAEHDPLASALLVTPAPELAKAVAAAVTRQLSALPRREIAEQSLARFGAILVVPDIEAAIEIANRIAPEHLELQLESPFDWLGRIRHAGAVFLGRFTPEPVGDYIAGPNHVLPTAGTARFSSALGVETFLKRTSIVYYNAEAFAREADDILRLARVEGLEAHARSIDLRRRLPGGGGKGSATASGGKAKAARPGKRR